MTANELGTNINTRWSTSEVQKFTEEAYKQGEEAEQKRILEIIKKMPKYRAYDQDYMIKEEYGIWINSDELKQRIKKPQTQDVEAHKMEYKQLTKEDFDLLAEALEWKGKKCGICGKIITRDNFGILHADYVCCNDFLCQVKTLDKIETGVGL